MATLETLDMQSDQMNRDRIIQRRVLSSGGNRRRLLLALCLMLCVLLAAPGVAATDTDTEEADEVLLSIQSQAAAKDVASNNGTVTDGDVGSGGAKSSTAEATRKLAHTGPECGEDGSGLNHDGVPCKYPYEAPDSDLPNNYIDHTISGAKLTNGVYPSSTLSCYSSYTKPDGMLICPESRSKFCVKELSTLKQDLCGQSQYFGDQYLENLCVLRKCAAECKEGQYSFSYAGLDYVRQRFCCQENYCNSATARFASATILTAVAVAVLSCIFVI